MQKYFVSVKIIINNLLKGGISLTFAKRLKQLRELEGLKQIELAEKLNLTSAALSQYEKGIREPNSEMLKKIADYFDVSTDFLLGRIDKININKEKPILDPSIKTIAAHRIGPIEDLDDEAIEKINEYIEFIRMQQNKK